MIFENLLNIILVLILFLLDGYDAKMNTLNTFELYIRKEKCNAISSRPVLTRAYVYSFSISPKDRHIGVFIWVCVYRGEG